MHIHKPGTISHSNQLIEGILIAITELIADAQLKYSEVKAATFSKNAGFVMKSTAGYTGGVYSTASFTLWFNLSEDVIGTIEVSRQHIPLTSLEMTVLGSLPQALAGLTPTSVSKRLDVTQRIAGRLSLEHLWITKYLRKVHGSRLWTPALIVRELQELTFKRYEGHNCTSGFIFTSKPKLYLAEVTTDLPYELIAFPTPILFTVGFFNKPASFRYVDGRNAFYLIDNWRRVHGVFRAREPQQFDIIDRCAQLHVEPLVRRMPGRTWSAYIGNNNDVNIYARGGAHFKWEGNHWHMRVDSLLRNILTEHGCAPQFANKLSPVIFALSDLRLGAVLLITKDANTVAPSIGVIDNSDLGKGLRSSFLNASFDDLVKSHAVIGVLSSDGLATMTTSGQLIGCGEIIDISTALGAGMAGGGRTHAATAASAYGLAIKVSEDGPISVFFNKERLITL